ncbi:MAG: alpha-xylosidase, partial [Elusimicrobiota bacterium]|nr:alpha-xylosidase [Endomicrobiia bacterium]MDW8166534.1 alpha-xylosidase [Elusimicrobiota bacterium]
MRFTDGHWRIREGIKIHYPCMIWDYEIKEGEIVVFAPSIFVKNRGETLFGPLFEIHFTSPLPNIIEVKSYHFKGVLEKGPYFELNKD